MACLHRVAMGTLLLSRRSWSVHLVRGRPGGRFHVWSGGRPTDNSTWRSMAWCGGVLSGNLATCPNMALRPLVIRSDAGARPVRKETSELRTKSCHLIPTILRWHFTVKGFDGFHVTGKRGPCFGCIYSMQDAFIVVSHSQLVHTAIGRRTMMFYSNKRLRRRVPAKRKHSWFNSALPPTNSRLNVASAGPA